MCQTSACHTCAPVEYSDYPALGHLLGRIEHIPHMGAMLTDFTLIKPGALHMANGGYLIVDAERVLTLPGSWQALKRCLRSEAIAIEPPATGLSTTTAVTLEPEPIPLDIKVILIGRRDTFYMLQAADPEFSDHFKVAADFNEVITWTDDCLHLFCRLLGSIARREETRDLAADACAAVIERAARMASDTERLTLRVGQIADIVREANYWAGKDNARSIKRVHIEKAVSEQVRRLDRIRERMHEQILRKLSSLIPRKRRSDRSTACRSCKSAPSPLANRPASPPAPALARARSLISSARSNLAARCTPKAC